MTVIAATRATPYLSAIARARKLGARCGALASILAACSEPNGAGGVENGASGGRSGAAGSAAGTDAGSLSSAGGLAGQGGSDATVDVADDATASAPHPDGEAMIEPRADASDDPGDAIAAADRCDVAVCASAAPVGTLAVSGSTDTHDPSLIQSGSTFYLFGTGTGISAKTSTDLALWRAAPNVFVTNPVWIASQVPGATNLWAPDISYFGAQFHLYYAASTFGSNHSCIGHATRTALDTGAFSDHGSVICSNMAGANDNWNAIDPDVIVDEAGVPWLAFGSFWGGIKLIKLDSTGARGDASIVSLAARPTAGGAVEAPYVVRRCGYYYLFTSWDNCCDGVNSTYNIRVGRSASVTGPYVDKDGKGLMQGGGTLVTAGDVRWKGPGHDAVIFTADKAYNVYHALDANNGALATLRVSDLCWDAEGWPLSGGP